jgi:hypothetical protein
VYEIVIPVQTPLPPGGEVRSKVFDLDGFVTASINVSITAPDAQVERRIHFGPAPNNGFALVRSDTFGTSNHLYTAMPVHAPQAFIIVANRGTQTHTVDATVYAAH